MCPLQTPPFCPQHHISDTTLWMTQTRNHQFWYVLPRDSKIIKKVRPRPNKLIIECFFYFQNPCGRAALAIKFLWAWWVMPNPLFPPRGSTLPEISYTSSEIPCWNPEILPEISIWNLETNRLSVFLLRNFPLPSYMGWSKHRYWRGLVLKSFMKSQRFRNLVRYFRSVGPLGFCWAHVAKNVMREVRQV